MKSFFSSKGKTPRGFKLIWKEKRYVEMAMGQSRYILRFLMSKISVLDLHCMKQRGAREPKPYF